VWTGFAEALSRGGYPQVLCRVGHPLPATSPGDEATAR